MRKAEMGMAGWVLVGLGIFDLFSIVYVMGKYNGLVRIDTEVQNRWGYVQSAYQLRADKIPNLVETVKGAKNFEQETLIKIAELRSQAGQAKIDVGNAKDVAELEQAESSMRSVLSRLMVIVENYPDLKSNQNFLALQDEISETENKIQFERNKYNEAVKGYQTGVRMFPGNIIAGMFGFGVDKHKMFQAEDGAQKAPKVNFG